MGIPLFQQVRINEKKYYFFDTNAIIATYLSFPQKWESIPYNQSFTTYSFYMDHRSRSGMTGVCFWSESVDYALSYIKFILLIKGYSHL